MKYGLIYNIVDFNADIVIKRRLIDLGFRKSSNLQLIKRSILKANFLVSVDGVVYAIRKELANKIIVKEK
ncbi:MAG: FeoA domain-containing protein [Clostridia bacterium]|nr:FeoA domain-containing protein [Clostridia bacterium]